MKTRVLVAAGLMPIVLAVYFGPAWLFFLLAVAAGLVVAWETLRLFEAKGLKPLAAPAYAAVVLISLAFHEPTRLEPAAALAIVAALAFGAHLLLRPGVEDALPSLAATLFVAVVPVLLIGFQMALRTIPESVTLARGGLHATALLVYLYAVVFGQDAAAYFVGRRFGRLKLSPRVSPNKTVEGLVGGIVGGIVLGLAFTAWLAPGLSLREAGLFAAILGSAGAFGDLCVSLLKRSAGVKDSGTLLPGHGGLLDRLAGLLFAAPVLYLLVRALPAAAAKG